MLHPVKCGVYSHSGKNAALYHGAEPQLRLPRKKAGGVNHRSLSLFRSLNRRSAIPDTGHAPHHEEKRRSLHQGPGVLAWAVRVSPCGGKTV